MTTSSFSDLNSYTADANGIVSIPVDLGSGTFHYIFCYRGYAFQVSRAQTSRHNILKAKRALVNALHFARQHRPRKQRKWTNVLAKLVEHFNPV